MVSALSAGEIGAQTLSLGPQVYELVRKRDGGSHQKGWLGGVQLFYQRLPTNGFYLDAELNYGTGLLKGHSSGTSSLKSTMTEFSAIGRLGWTLSFCCLRSFSFSPYAGYGWFRGRNDFQRPSPLVLRFDDRYGFPLAGALLSVQWTEAWNSALRFEGRWMADASEKVSGDVAADRRLKMGDDWHYNCELFLNYDFSWRERCWRASLVPFYTLRHYGGWESYPFDFIKTRYTLYGVRFLIGFRI